MDTIRHTVTVRTLCFIFNDKNEVLLIKRGTDKFDAGMYNALGGHVEKNEDILQSAEREIFEETGIKPVTTKLSGFVHVSDFFGKNVLMFITQSKTTQEEVIDSDEGTLCWVNLNDIDNYNIYEDVRPFLDRIMKSSKMFGGVSRFDGKGKLLNIDLHSIN